MIIRDNFLSTEEYDDLTSTPMQYAKVHWIGVNAEPENALHRMVHQIYDKHVTQKGISGGTAWWNIRPVNPQLHNDISSYCTQNGIDYRPDVLPKETFIYYVKEPESGGYLKVQGLRREGDGNLEPYNQYIKHNKNRLISFSANTMHGVEPYEGNRVSVGVIFWPELPIIYGPTNEKINAVYERAWEIEDAK